MKWSSFLSQASTPDKAVAEACQAVTASLHGRSSGAAATPLVDFAAVFISEGWEAHYRDFIKLLKPHLAAKVLIGCSGGGVIGGGKEVEHQPAVSLTAAMLPDVTLYPFYVKDDRLPDLDAGPEAWRNIVGIPADENPQFILLADPFSFRTETFVLGMDYAFPNAHKIGGLSSGGRGPGENVLYLNTQIFTSGLVGVGFTGNIVVDPLVAQGCRPIGKPMTITDCDSNILIELDHHTPVQILEDLIPTLSTRDRELAASSLFLGVLMNPMKTEISDGDFLIRNLMGIDSNRGALAVGEVLRVGQQVQFFVRDSQTSAENLRSLLETYKNGHGESAPRGALLFSCLGRGEYLYGFPDHDSSLFHKTFGYVPLGGFFCNGEIGPVGGATYLHGFTSCFGIVRTP